MTQLAYAGIGARRTPPDMLRNMTALAAWPERRGWHLHSGGAAGADTALAAGAPQARTLYLPWPGYQDHSGPDCHVPSGDLYRSCVRIAEAVHPAWHRCTPGARKLHARNVSILLGRELDSPVLAVVCWTDGADRAVEILREAVDRYYEWRRAHRASFVTSGNILHLFRKYVGEGARCDAIGEADLLTFLAGEGPLTRYRANKCGALAGFYRYAIGRGDTADRRSRRPAMSRDSRGPGHLEWSSNFRAIALKKATPQPIAWLSKAEIKALLEVPDRRTPGDRIEHALLLFLYNTGARVSEATGLVTEDLEIGRRDGGHVLVTIHGRGGKRPQCPHRPRTERVLSELAHGRAAGDAVFLSRQRRPYTRFGVYRLVERCAAQLPSLAGRTVTPHMVRHTSACHLLQTGVDLNTIRARPASAPGE